MVDEVFDSKLRFVMTPEKRFESIFYSSHIELQFDPELFIKRWVNKEHGQWVFYNSYYDTIWIRSSIWYIFLDEYSIDGLDLRKFLKKMIETHLMLKDKKLTEFRHASDERGYFQ